MPPEDVANYLLILGTIPGGDKESTRGTGLIMGYNRAWGGSGLLPGNDRPRS